MPTESQSRIESFRRQFRELGYGDGHFHLLCHAAFPIAITPDLLYRIWLNFLNLNGKPLADRVAVSDVLLWSAWRETAPEIFELPEDIRSELLKELQQRFGVERFKLMAQFLYQYTKQPTGPNDDVILRQAHLLGVQATLAPQQVARQLEQELTASVVHNQESEILRLRNIIGALASQHADFKPLLAVAKGLKAALLGMSTEVVNRQFDLANTGTQQQVYGVRLDDENMPGDAYLTIPLLQSMGHLDLPDPKIEPKDNPSRVFHLAVGINDYHDHLSQLKGCVNDAQLLHEVLARHRPIQSAAADGASEDLVLLLNEFATKEAILGQLQKWLNQAGPNDLVVFSFSGHGSNAGFSANNMGQQHAENQIITYEYVHSAPSDSTRNPNSRGSSQQQGAIEYQAEKGIDGVITESEFQSFVRTQGLRDPHILMITDTHNGSPGWLDSQNPKHVILTSGSNWDTSIEMPFNNQSHGLLTMALVQALNSLPSLEAQTYHALIRKIYKIIENEGYQSQQTPQLFGTPAALKRPFMSVDNTGNLYLQELKRECQPERNRSLNPLALIDLIRLEPQLDPSNMGEQNSLPGKKAIVSESLHVMALGNLDENVYPQVTQLPESLDVASEMKYYSRKDISNRSDLK